MMALGLPRRILVQTALRSLLLQASWNFERLQGLGALYVVAPALRFLYRDRELQEAYGRHTEYFNTHPFLAPAVLGATIQLEQARAAGEPPAFQPGEFKTVFAAPCAAMGDAFFWGGVRPLAAVCALIFAVQGRLWAPLVLLGVFNLPHLYCRFRGLLLGLQRGPGIADELLRLGLPDWAIRLKQLTVILLGILCADLTIQVLAENRMAHLWGLLLIPALTVVGWLSRRSVSPLLIALGVSVVLLLVFSMR